MKGSSKIQPEVIFASKEHNKYLGKQLAELRGKYISLDTFEKLQIYEAHTRKSYGLSALDTLFLLHQRTSSFNDLGKICHISRGTLVKIFDSLGLPRLSKREATNRYLNLRTPEKKRRIAQIARIAYQTKTPLFIRKENCRRAGLASQAATPLHLRREKSKKAYKAGLGKLTLDQRLANARKAGLASQSSRTPQRLKQLKANMKKAKSLLTSKQLSANGKKAFASGNLLTPEQARDNIRSYLSSLTLEQRSELGKKGRLSQGAHPNRPEALMIFLLHELGVYAEDGVTAQKGKVYYADTKVGTRYIQLSNGRIVIPDFKVKGVRKVIEVYGDYWHSKIFCESRGDPEYKWNAQKMIEEYAAVGYEALILWEKEIKDKERQDFIKAKIITFLKYHKPTEARRIR